MGWLDGSTGGERAANTYTANDQQRRAHQEKMGDVAWERKLRADFNARNQRHKLAAFEMEKQEARRENRPPRIWSPEEVPDLELPPELQPREVQPARPLDLSWLKWPAIAFGLWLPFGITMQVMGGFPGIISIPVLAAVLLTEVWLVLRHLAKDDAEKLASADKWNPVNVAKTSTAWVKARTAGQQASRPAGPSPCSSASARITLPTRTPDRKQKARRIRSGGLSVSSARCTFRRSLPAAGRGPPGRRTPGRAPATTRDRRGRWRRPWCRTTRGT